MNYTYCVMLVNLKDNSPIKKVIVSRKETKTSSGFVSRIKHNSNTNIAETKVNIPTTAVM